MHGTVVWWFAQSPHSYSKRTWVQMRQPGSMCACVCVWVLQIPLTVQTHAVFVWMVVCLCSSSDMMGLCLNCWPKLSYCSTLKRLKNVKRFKWRRCGKVLIIQAGQISGGSSCGHTSQCNKKLKQYKDNSPQVLISRIISLHSNGY